MQVWANQYESASESGYRRRASAERDRRSSKRAGGRGDAAMNDHTQRIVKMLLLLTAMISVKANAETLTQKILPPKTNVAASSLQSYLDRVRADNSSLQPTSGSIWTDSGRLTRMTTTYAPCVHTT